jgi:hypothetical protein
MNTDFTEANEGNKEEGLQNFRKLSKLSSMVVQRGTAATKECQTTDEHR